MALNVSMHGFDISHMMGNVKTENILRELTLYGTFLCKIEDPQRISRFDQII